MYKLIGLYSVVLHSRIMLTQQSSYSPERPLFKHHDDKRHIILNHYADLEGIILQIPMSLLVTVYKLQK